MNRENRAILYNQYEILKHLDPDQAGDYEKYQSVLSSGYTHLYDNILIHISPDEASPDMQQETFDILSMFRALNIAKRNGWVPTDEDDAKFNGFDGNNDDHYHFAAFLLDDEGLFDESSPSKNSHSIATLARYRRMLGVWTALEKTYELTSDEAESIIKA